MKALKLVLLFILLLAITVGIILIPELLDKSSNDGMDGEYTASFKDAKEQIEKEWQNADDWSIEHFLDTKDYLSVREDKLGKSGYATLENRFEVKALDCLYKKTIALFSNPHCKNAVVNTFYNDMKRYCKEAPKQSEAEQIDTLQGIHDVYKRAYLLINRKIGLETEFHKSAEKNKWWNDFNEYEDTIEIAQINIKKEAYFNHISGIIEIKNGLKNISPELAKAKSVFLSQLINDIDSCFTPRIEEIQKCTSEINVITEQDDLDEAKKNKSDFENQKNLLLNMRIHFRNQFVSFAKERGKVDSIVSRMSKAYTSFEKSLEEAEKRVESMKKQNDL